MSIVLYTIFCVHSVNEFACGSIHHKHYKLHCHLLFCLCPSNYCLSTLYLHNLSASLKVYLRMSFINFCKLSLRSCGPTRVCVAKSLIKWKSDRISSDNPKIHYKRRTCKFQLFQKLSPQGNTKRI